MRLEGERWLTITDGTRLVRLLIASFVVSAIDVRSAIDDSDVLEKNEQIDTHEEAGCRQSSP